MDYDDDPDFEEWWQKFVEEEKLSMAGSIYFLSKSHVLKCWNAAQEAYRDSHDPDSRGD